MRKFRSVKAVTVMLIVAFLFHSMTLTVLANPSDGKLEIAAGTHIKWVERLDLPDYAYDVYVALGEWTDNDGVEDYLIEDKYFQYGTDSLYDYVSADGVPFSLLQVYDSTVIYLGRVEKSSLEYALVSIEAAIDAFRNDHPEIFWVHYTNPSIAYMTIDDKVDLFLRTRMDSIGVDMRESGYDQTAIKRDIEKQANVVASIIESIPKGASEEEMLRHFNTYLTSANQYATGGGIESSGKAFTAIVGNIGENGPVCLGYASAMKLLCDKVGIPCTIVSGPTEAGGKNIHAWNYVELDNMWYAIDVTWNDPSVEDGSPLKIEKAVSGYESEEYFLCGSETQNHNGVKFIENHIPTCPVQLPSGVYYVSNCPTLSKKAYTGAYHNFSIWLPTFSNTADF